MDTEKYRTLICAIDTGSLTAAAEKLGYTPSGISRSVLAVEEEFGFPLLVRAKSGVTPTTDCEKLLPIIRNLLRIEEQLKQTADRICSLETWSMHGFGETLGSLINSLSLRLHSHSGMDHATSPIRGGGRGDDTAGQRARWGGGSRPPHRP